MSAMNGQIIRTDMFVNDVLIGRSSANLDTFDTQTNTTSTTVLDLETTNTLNQMYELKAGDEVNRLFKCIILWIHINFQVYVNVNYVGTMSLILSSMNYQIFFTGEWIRAL